MKEAADSGFFYPLEKYRRLTDNSYPVYSYKTDQLKIVYADYRIHFS